MTKHVMSNALLASAALMTLKGEEDDPISIVTKSLADLQKSVDDKLKAMPGGAELKALMDRLAELEKKANRPGTKTDKDEAAEIERKALASLLRSGTHAAIVDAGGLIEGKAASSDSDPSGGYFVLPTIDLTIRTLMTDL